MTCCCGRDLEQSEISKLLTELSLMPYAAPYTLLSFKYNRTLDIKVEPVAVKGIMTEVLFLYDCGVGKSYYFTVEAALNYLKDRDAILVGGFFE